MICTNCQLAGDCTTVANRETVRKDIHDSLVARAITLHKQCRNNDVKPAKKKDPASDKTRLTTWCDCQHSTGVYINSSLIRTASVETTVPKEADITPLRFEAEKDTNATVE